MAADSKMLFPGTAAQGGTYECQIYNQASGGVPIATHVAFNYADPSTWVAPAGTVWASGGSLNEPPEAALLVEWAAGLSSSGKPVKLRKWYHMVPTSRGTGVNPPDVVAADLTALQVQAQAIVGVLGAKGLSLGSATGRLAGVASVSPFYGNHQMPRGRRRKPLVTASGKYTGPSLTFPIPGSGAQLPQDD